MFLGVFWRDRPPAKMRNLGWGMFWGFFLGETPRKNVKPRLGHVFWAFSGETESGIPRRCET